MSKRGRGRERSSGHEWPSSDVRQLGHELKGSREPLRTPVNNVSEFEEPPQTKREPEITARKQAENALHQLTADIEGRLAEQTLEIRHSREAAQIEHQRLYDVLETLPVYVILLSADYRVPFANRFFRDRFGESHGKRCFEYLFNRTEACETCETYRVMKTNAPHHWEWTGPDGRDYDIYDFPFIDSDGSLLILEMGIDITERRRAEAALKEANERLEQRVAERTAELRASEEHLARAQAIAHLGSWELDVASHQLSWSDEVYRIFGLQPQEFGATYEAFLEAVHPDDRAMVDAAYSGSVRERKDSYEIEHRVVRRSTGEIRWVQEKCQHVRDAQGGIIRSLGMVMDITDRKRAEEARTSMLDAEQAARTEYERINRVKDEFLATVSHELRNPLSAIMGWAQLLARGKAQPDRAAEIIQQNVATLTQIVEDMLDMGRVITGKIRLAHEKVELDLLVAKVLDGVGFSAEAKGVHLDSSFSPHLQPIEADPGRLQQVLWNLITNAIKFTPPGGRISVAVSPSDQAVEIRVSDTGQGISPEFLPHIFERFRQQDMSVARTHGGLGLGLAIVKHLVELHGGTIRAESKGESQGATFIVSLPCNARTDTLDANVTRGWPFEGPSIETLSLEPNNLEGVRILAVDDAPHNREFLSQLLSEDRATVHVVESARHALDILAKFKPDLLISDIGMPGMDGYSFIKEVRSAPMFATLPCLALTALARPEDREQALAAGFNEHLNKLCDPSVLASMIRMLVGRGRVETVRDTDCELEPRREVQANASRPRHVLLAEDHSTIAHLLKGTLEQEGYRVSVAETIADAIAIAQESPVDILLSDLRLRDGMGWDLLARLQGERKIPGIVMSGYLDETYVTRSKRAGFAEYLAKPVDTDELLKAMANALRTSN